MSTADPRRLAKQSYKEAENTLANRSIGATVLCVFHISAFAWWLRTVYVGYEAWRAGTGSLPETGIVKVGIPMFLTSISVEVILAVAARKEVYRLNDSLASMSNGLFQTMLDAVVFNVLGEILGVVFITAIPYHLIHEHWRIVRLEGLWGFIGMILARDFCYYWFHRVSHRVAFMWAVHGVHHEPNEFNYSVNLSQGALQRVTEACFYAPLALFFPPEVYVLIYPIAKIYGFFTHTRLVSKPYLLEWLFVTPSAHRVHHAGAPALYIDKNYSECFSIWDRMFGTFQPEEPAVVYGHVHPMSSWDPIRAQTAVWRAIFSKAAQCNAFLDKIKCFLMPPGWDPKTGGEFPLVDSTPYSAVKYDSDLPAAMSFYAVLHFVPAMAGGIAILHAWKSMSYPVLFAAIVFVTYSLMCIGRLYDRAPSALRLELLRLLAMASGVAWLAPRLPPQLQVPPAVTVMVANAFDFTLRQVSSRAVLGAAATVLALSAVVLLQNRRLFAAETRRQWEERVWIPEAGRSFGAKLKAAGGKLDLAHITATSFEG